MTSRKVLKIEGVSVGTLEDVSFEVAAGETVCLSGASGSGKTRLLRAIADLDAHSGRISLESREQDAMTGHQWRGEVMMVPAESQWWAESVGEHFIDTPTVDLKALGFDDATMTWQVSRLSSGEKQRLALLRAVSRRPKALLLDEPTANLDNETTRRTEKWLKQVAANGGMPVLWVAHDVEQIRRVADCHYRIEGTRLERVG